MATGDSREPGRRASLRSAANRRPQNHMRLRVVYILALVAIDICKVNAKPFAATPGCLQKLATGRKDLPPVHVCGCVGLRRCHDSLLHDSFDTP